MVTHPKQGSLHTCASKIVRSSKPANRSDTAFTDKTGGCKNETSVRERISAQAPEVSMDGNASRRIETGGTVILTKPTCQFVLEKVVQ